MPGRKRDPRLDTEIRLAALKVLGEGGYRQFALESVAALVGIPKSTIYKRWPSRSALAAGVLAEWLRRMTEANDLGENLRAALIAVVKDEIDISQRPEGRAVAQLVLVHWDEPHEANDVLIQAMAERRGALVQILHDAAARGEMPQMADVELVVDLLIGAVWAPIISIRETGPSSPETIVDTILASIGFKSSGQ